MTQTRKLPAIAQLQEGAVLLVDKPLDWTSFDVVNKIKYKLKYRLGLKNLKVGHAGTLDPKATGLLVICTGGFTRRIETYQAQEKEYTGTFVLGATRPSFDLETEIDAHFPIDQLTTSLLHEAATTFLGAIEQRPPVFSAIKVNGQRVYKKARQGKTVELQPRPVEIRAFELTSIALPEVEFRVCCSKGTYIRSLAHDFGQAVHSGAYLGSLRRTRIGDFRVEDAWDVESLAAAIELAGDEAGIEDSRKSILS